MRRLWTSIVLCVLLHVAVASFGIGDVWVRGAYGNHGAEYGGAALRTIRFDQFLFTHWWGEREPPPSATKLKHPVLWHQYLVPAYWLLGDREVTPRIVPVVFSALSLVFFALIARRLYGERWAWLAALLFAIEPHNIYFASTPDPQHAAMLGSLVGLHGYLRTLGRPNWRNAGIVAAGFSLGCLGEWPAYYVAFALAVHAALVRARCPSETWLGWPIERWRLAMFCALILALFGSHFLIAARVGALDSIWSTYAIRTAPHPHYGARVWFTLSRMHGLALLALGASWLAVLVYRGMRRRTSAAESVPLLLAFAVALNAVVFPNEFGTHIYRSFFLGPTLVWGAVALLAAACERWPVGWVSAGLVALLLASVVPASASMLWESRALGGRVAVDSHDLSYPEILTAREVGRRTAAGSLLYVDGMPDLWPVRHYLRRDQIWSRAVLPRAARARRSYALVRVSPRSKRVLHELVRAHPTTILEAFALVDLSRVGFGIEAYALRARAPDWRWRWFCSAVRPPMTFVPDSALARRVAREIGLPAP